MLIEHQKLSRNKRLSKRFEDFLSLKGMVSHDIKNSLSAVGGYSDLMQMGVPFESEEYIAGSIILGKVQEIKKAMKFLEKARFPYPTSSQGGVNPLIKIRRYESILKNQSERIVSLASDIAQYCNSIQVEESKVDRIKRASEGIMDVAEMTAIGNISKQTIKETSTHVDLVEAVKNIFGFYGKELKEKEYDVGLVINYDENIPLVYTNRRLLGGALNVCAANMWEYALSGTTAEVGIALKDGDLEIIVSNYYNGTPERPTAGQKQGKGTPFAKKVISQLGGTFEMFAENKGSQMWGYQCSEELGCSESGNHPEGAKMHISKITLPASPEFN